MAAGPAGAGGMSAVALETNSETVSKKRRRAQDVNSETVSKKRGRGRPRSYAAADQVELFAVWRGVRTVRSLQNKSCAATAFSVMTKIPDCRERWRWILGNDEQRLGKSIVLTELGRLEQPETICRAADWICEQARREPKLTAKDAATRIRCERMNCAGRPAQRPSVYCLSQAILKAIDDYRATHPGMDWDDVLDALNVAYSDVEECAG
jgi:hypothetical protein